MIKDSKKFSENEKEEAESQIRSEMRIFDYDTVEYPIEVIVQKYLKKILDGENEIFIPDYQREFVWKEQRKSKFIESILLGIPIPYIFLADVNGRLEIVDGSQRIRTLVEFLSDSELVDQKLKLNTTMKELKEDALILKDLKRLDKLNGFSFNDLPKTRQHRFLNRSLKFIVLSEKTDVISRKELFERINTGSDELEAMEVRKGTHDGPFYDLIKKCAKEDLFKKLCPISEKTAIREEAEERVLRFFAYSSNLEIIEKEKKKTSKSLNIKKYNGEVRKFLDSFMQDTTKNFTKDKEKEFYDRFNSMLSFVDKFFPYGFKKDKKHASTPRVRFETISLGVYQVLKTNPTFTPKNSILNWLESDEFKAYTRSDAANNKSKVIDRIEYVVKNLLG